VRPRERGVLLPRKVGSNSDGLRPLPKEGALQQNPNKSNLPQLLHNHSSAKSHSSPVPPPPPNNRLFRPTALVL